MKKKIYERPQVEITEAKAAEIICTSGVMQDVDPIITPGMDSNDTPYVF